jgi:signal transduction histidine kinase
MEGSEQSAHQVEEERFRRLIDVGSSLLSELDIEVVLKSVVDAARELTNARYAALGVLDRERRELERFINVGIDEGTRRMIGNLPRGRGVLGELIREPAPLRLRDVEAHPHAYGFPPGHPPMHSFLGVPISVRGETYGNLYMTEKQGAAEFDEADEEAALTLASWAGIAIENARLYTSLSEREAETEQALRRAETSVDIARTVGGETDVERVLDLIVKRARALVDASALLVLLRRKDHLYIAARAGSFNEEVHDLVVPLDSVFGAAMEDRVSQRLDRNSPPSEARLRERLGAEAALVVPLLFRGRAVGVLVALDREAGGVEFDQEDLRLLQSFAASAATAVATAQTVESERLRQQVESAERERERWARELHDDALQGLAAIRISLAAALQSKGERRADLIESAAEETMVRLERQINDLNRLINDLRPAALERLGLAGALRALADESAARGAIEIEARIELGTEQASGDAERIVYRLVQEALTNILKHAEASHVEVSAEEAESTIRIRVHDDGSGFDPASTGGRGLSGMRERIELFGGRIDVTSEPGEGTDIAATVPLGTDL